MSLAQALAPRRTPTAELPAPRRVAPEGHAPSGDLVDPQRPPAHGGGRVRHPLQVARALSGRDLGQGGPAWSRGFRSVPVHVGIPTDVPPGSRAPRVQTWTLTELRLPSPPHLTALTPVSAVPKNSPLPRLPAHRSIKVGYSSRGKKLWQGKCRTEQWHEPIRARRRPTHPLPACSSVTATIPTTTERVCWDFPSV